MSILLIGSFLILMILLFMKPLLLRFVSPTNIMVRKLNTASWFQHTGWSGLFLFLLNALLFGLTVALLFLLSHAFIPLLHLFVMLFAILASLFVWISIHHADQKERKERLIMGFIGSSFYLLLFGMIVYRILTLETGKPEYDQFMEFISLFFISIVALTAWIICLVITGFYRSTRTL